MKYSFPNFKKHTFRLIIISLITIAVLWTLFLVFIFISAYTGPARDDVVLFDGGIYVISKYPNSYSLFEEDNEILSHVKGYWIGIDKSYVKNDTVLVTIDQIDSTYSKKHLSEINGFEKNIIKSMNTLPNKLNK
ncbi:hypothetical protein ACFSTH_14025 [Paenibacillus yanchengensis]|uniref:Uncharacterized protein n=1 Tax=Paenibacillus yanchengensis TaxID=2035833 RepID=A0ABW4YN73_9BACL